MTQLDRVDNIHQRIGQVRARLEALNSTVDQQQVGDSRTAVVEAAADWRRQSAPRVAATQLRFDADRRQIHQDGQMDVFQRQLASMREQHSPPLPLDSITRAQSRGAWDRPDAIPRGTRSFPDDDAGRSVSGEPQSQLRDEPPPAASYAPIQRMSTGPFERQSAVVVENSSSSSVQQPPQVLSFYEMRPQMTESVEPQPASQAPPSQEPPPGTKPTSFSQMQALLRAKLAEFAAERQQQPQDSVSTAGQRDDVTASNPQQQPAASSSSRRTSVAFDQHTFAPTVSTPTSSRFAPAPVPTYEPQLIATEAAAAIDANNPFGNYQESHRSQSGDSQTLLGTTADSNHTTRRVSSTKRLDSMRAKQAPQPQPSAASFSKRNGTPTAGGASYARMPEDEKAGLLQPQPSLIAQLVGTFSDPKSSSGIQASVQSKASREHFLSTPMLRAESKRQPEIARDSPRMSVSPRTGSNTVTGYDQQQQVATSSRSQTPRKATPIAPAVVAAATAPASSSIQAGNGGARLIGGGSDAHLVALSGAELFAILRLRGVISSHGQTGEHLLPLTSCHSMFLSTDEYSQLLQLRELLKTQARASPKNASERRRVSPGASPAAATNSTLSLRATEAALMVAEQRRNRTSR